MKAIFLFRPKESKFGDLFFGYANICRFFFFFFFFGMADILDNFWECG